MRGELPKLTDVNIDDYLTEQDYDKKKAGIISRIVNKPITIDYRKGINCAFLKQDSSFHITKSLPKIKGIDGNTAMNHELAHILFESFDPRAIRTVNEWALKWNNSEQKESDLAKKIYYEALNVIEDQRIESLWGKIYLGNFKDFIRVRKKLGKDLEFVESPTFSLLAERFFREDLLPNSKYGFVGKLIHDVEGKDVMASILVLNKIKPYLDETIKNALKLKEEFLFESSNVRSMKGETHRATYEEIKKAEEKRDKVHSDFQKATCQSNVARKIDDKNRIESLHQIDIVSAEPYEKEELANYEKKLEELKQSADEKLNSIKIAMEGGDVPINKVEVRVKPIKKNSAPIEPKINAGVVKEMKRLLRCLKKKVKTLWLMMAMN